MNVRGGAASRETREREAAQRLGLAYQPLEDRRLHPGLSPEHHLAAARNGALATVASAAGSVLAVSPATAGEARLADQLRIAPASRDRIIATSADELTGLYLRDSHADIPGAAIRFLRDGHPGMSASPTIGGLQALGLLATLAGIAAAAFFHPYDTAGWAALVLSLVFLSTTGLRLAALAAPAPGSQPWIELSDEHLPVYSILVPLYREANIVHELFEALEDLDYPAARLDIKILLEADDIATRDAVDALNLPDHYSILALPDFGPRTKPKALNIGLALARGNLVCVFDAEDRPDADQLRQAAGAFAIAPADYACLQARLAYRNWNQSWLTRQFAIEYAAQFDVMVPVICWLGLPLPLGGTSNHFRTALLRDAGGWDAYNVTEDADLGVRLARLGYRVGVIDSTTFEEAPARLQAWVKQRTRWMKGWMQTLLVHTRNPFSLIAELGTFGMFGFVATVIANLASAVIHPAAIGLIVWQASSGAFFSGDNILAAAVAALASANLVFGYVIALASAAFGLFRRPMPGLSLHLILTPFYWLLSALAFILALIDLIRRPYFWAKTEHGIAKRDAPVQLRRKRPARRRHK